MPGSTNSVLCNYAEWISIWNKIKIVLKFPMDQSEDIHISRVSDSFLFRRLPRAPWPDPRPIGKEK